jgi:hypothetical protein
MIMPHAMSSRHKSRHATCCGVSRCIASLCRQAVLFLPPTNSQQNQPLDLPSVYVAVCLSICLPVCLSVCLSVCSFLFRSLRVLLSSLVVASNPTMHSQKYASSGQPRVLPFPFPFRLPFAVRAPQCDMPCPALSCLPPLHDMTSSYPLPTFPSRISESALD